MVCFDFHVHQAFNFNRIQIATDHHAQVIGDEFHDMVVILQRRILAKNWAGMGILDIRFDRHQAFLAHLGKNFIKHRQQVDVQGFGKF